MWKHIPNLLTLLNLTTGFYGILGLTGLIPVPSLLLLGDQNETKLLSLAFTTIIISGIFDVFDGWIARKVGANGELGKQLDSLADLISFGLLPSLFLYQWMLHLNLSKGYVLISMIFVSCAALRLAKFNIDTRQTSSFLGLPTPGAALLICSLIFWPNIVAIYPIILPVIGLIIAVIMVIELPMLAFKSLGSSPMTNKIFLIITGFFIICLIFLGLKAIFLTLLLYILLCFTAFLIRRNPSNT